jgi:hypothetical protein
MKSNLGVVIYADYLHRHRIRVRSLNYGVHLVALLLGTCVIYFTLVMRKWAEGILESDQSSKVSAVVSHGPTSPELKSRRSAIGYYYSV